MHVAFHIIVCHILHKIIVIRYRDDEQMEHRCGVLRMMLHGDQRIRDLPDIAVSDLLTSLRPLRQIFQADAQYRTLQSLQSIIISNLIMIITHIAALIFQAVNMLIVLFLLTGDTSAFSESIEVFARIEAEACQISQGSHIFPLKLCPVGLCAIFHHEQSVTVCDLAHACIIKGLAIEMDTDDSLRPLRDLRFQHGRINLPGIRRTICEHRRGSRIADAPCCRDISIGRNNDLISGAYAQRQHRQMQCGSTVVHTAGIFTAHVSSKFLVKCICIFASGKSCLTTYLLDSFSVSIFMGFYIPRQIDSLNMCHFLSFSLTCCHFIYIVSKLARCTFLLLFSIFHRDYPASYICFLI